MKVPEKSEVMATATLIMLASMPRLPAMLSVVWAKGQNPTTPMMLSDSNRSLPLYGISGSTLASVLYRA